MYDLSGKLARWRLRPSEFELGIAHRADIKHKAVDALSRLSTNGTYKTLLDDKVPVLVLRREMFV